MSNIKIIRLTTNDDVIGIIETFMPVEGDEISTEDFVIIRHPKKLNYEYDPKTKNHQIYFTSWMQSCVDTFFAISKDKIVTIGNPKVAVEEYYVEVVNRQLERPLLTDEQVDEDDLLDILANTSFDDDDL